MSTKLTEAAVKKMMLPALRTLAQKHFDPADLKGLKKAQLQEIVLENLDSINEAESVDDDDIEEDDDEVYEDIDEADSPESADSPDDADDEEDDEPQPAPTPKVEAGVKPKERETYTAKQVATRIGTDAKTLRKFFRSPASNFEPVGQGGRYEFDAADLPAIKEAFTKWNEGKAQRTTKKRETPAEPKRVAVVEELDEDIELDDDPEANFEEEPSEADLAELDDELDDEEED